MSHGQADWPDRITTLHQQGFVTHVLSPPADGIIWSINPRTVRDMDGLTLLVICDDGTVAVACPDGLPAVLDGMATSLGPVVGASSATLGAESVVGDHASGPPTLMAEPGSDASPIDEVAQPDGLSSTDTPDHQPGISVGNSVDSAAILSRLDQIGADLQAAQDRVTGGEARVLAELTRLLQKHAHDQSSSVTATVGGLGHAIRALQGEIDQDRLDLPSRADLRTAVDDMVSSIRADRHADAARSDATAQAVIARLDDLQRAPAAPDLSWLATALERQSDLTRQIVARLEDSAAREASAGLARKMEGLSVALAGVAAPTDILATLTDTVDRLSRDISVMAAATPVARVMPSDDHGTASLRQHIVRQGLVQNQLLRRLDRLLGAMETSGFDALEVFAQDAATTNAQGSNAWSEGLASLDGPTRLSIAEFVAGRMQKASGA